MNTDPKKSAKALDALFEEDGDLSIQELRESLEGQGIDVSQFMERFSAAVRKGCQENIKNAAQRTSEVRRQGKQSKFGDLASRTMAELISIRDQVLNGTFGPGLANAARCRNLQTGAELSESELRSWLEDISTSSDI